ncbi:MAG: CAP domain-containing protein [Pseudomonadota bacterium]
MLTSIPSSASNPKLVRSSTFGLALIAALLLGACGGGGGGSNESAGAAAQPPIVVTPTSVTAASAGAAQTTGAFQESGAPQATGNTATDGLNWFNFRRQQVGQPPLARTATIDTAAQGHSRYQQLNDTITHDQTAGRPGFTGVMLLERLTGAGYAFTRNSYAYGEVLSSTVDQSGFKAAEELITAIYHRFAVFEPMFREAGTGSAVSASGRTYFTANFAADGLTPVLGRSNFTIYPISNQQGLPTIFFSDFESPDPVPNRNQVGYPVSVHADITSTVIVQSFTIRPRNGALLQTILLDRATDPERTPASAAAIVPVEVLTGGTTYDVEFAGSVDGVAVARAWSFTTR